MPRVGLAGAGRMAAHHAGAIVRASAELVGVTDPDPAARRWFSGLHPECPTFETLAQMIERATPEVVHVCSPGSTHFPLALEAIGFGCHVYIEKPFALTVGEADELFQAARVHGVRLCAGHQLLFERPTAVAESLLPSLGRVVLVESFFSFRTNRRGTLSPAEQLLDILPHPTYLLHHFLERASPDLVLASPWGADVRLSDSGDVMATVSRAGVTGRLFVTLAGRPVESFMRIVGTNGTVQADYVRGTVQRLIGPGASGPDKLLAPYRLSRQLFWQTTAAMSKRVLRRQRSYPGLVEAFEAFYSEIDGAPAAVSRENIEATTRVVEAVAEEIAGRAAVTVAMPDRDERAVVVVTGGTGFLGRAIVERLAERGPYRVRVLARRNPPPWEAVSGVEYRSCDLSGRIDDEALRGGDVIVHCAAETVGGWEEHQSNSVAVVENLVTAAVQAGIDRLIHVSSVAVLTAKGPGPLHERSPLEPEPRDAGPYVWGKLESEVAVRRLSEERGLSLRVVRPGAIIDSTEFEPPGRLGKRLGNVFVGIGGRNEKLGVVELDLVARLMAWIVERFDETPVVVNVFDPDLPTRRELVRRLRARNPDLRVLWVPRFAVRPFGLILKVLQRLVRPNRPAIDIAKVFDHRSYSVDVARELVNRMDAEGNGAPRAAGVPSACLPDADLTPGGQNALESA